MKKTIEREIKVYWFIVVFVSVAFVIAVTWRGGDSTILVNQISFAAAITSIILAVVAILMSIFQSSDSGRQNEALRNTLENIQIQTLNLGNIRNDLLGYQKEVIGFRTESAENLAAVSVSLNRIENLIPLSLPNSEIKTIDKETIQVINENLKSAKEAIRKMELNVDQPIIMSNHKFNVMFITSDTDPNVIREEMENDPKLKQYNTKIKLEPSSLEGYYVLTITMPVENHGGMFGSAVQHFVDNAHKAGKWFKYPHEGMTIA